MRGLWIGLVCGCVWLCVSELPAQQYRIPTYRSPESFGDENKAADFLPYAQKFLLEHPYDERRPRIAFDLLMTGVALNDERSIFLGKECLLIEHPESLQAVFLVRTSAADNIRSVLREHFHKRPEGLDRKALFRFNRAFENYLKSYGPPADNEFWAQGALAAESQEAAAERRRNVKELDSDPAKLLDIALDASLPTREKYLRLQVVTACQSARAYQQFLYDHELSPADRAEPAIEKLAIKNLMLNSKYAAAVPRLVALRKESDSPQLAYWQALASAASGDPENAVKILDELQKHSPETAWATAGMRLRASLAGLAENSAAHLQIIGRVYETLTTTPLDVIELRADWQTKRKTDLSAYCAFNLREETFELMMFRNRETVVALRAAGAGNRLYTAGDPAISQFEASGEVPVFNAGINPNGLYYNFRMGKAGQGAVVTAVRECLRSAELASSRRREEALRAMIKACYYPEQVQTKDGTLLLSYLYPKLDEPTFDTTVIGVSKEYRVTSVLSAQYNLRDIQYGEQGLPLAAPSWPKIPTRLAREFGAKDWMQVMGVFLTIVEDKPAEAEVASQPATQR